MVTYRSMQELALYSWNLFKSSWQLVVKSYVLAALGFIGSFLFLFSIEPLPESLGLRLLIGAIFLTLFFGIVFPLSATFFRIIILIHEHSSKNLQISLKEQLIEATSTYVWHKITNPHEQFQFILRSLSFKFKDALRRILFNIALLAVFIFGIILIGIISFLSFYLFESLQNVFPSLPEASDCTITVAITLLVLLTLGIKIFKEYLEIRLRHSQYIHITTDTSYRDSIKKSFNWSRGNILKYCWYFACCLFYFKWIIISITLLIVSIHFRVTPLSNEALKVVITALFLPILSFCSVTLDQHITHKNQS